MLIINSIDDLRAWVEDHLAPEDDCEMHILANAISDSDDRPGYGVDWGKYLDGLFPADCWAERKAQILDETDE